VKYYKLEHDVCCTRVFAQASGNIRDHRAMLGDAQGKHIGEAGEAGEAGSKIQNNNRIILGQQLQDIL
jgi:hypothetical protein